MLQEFLSRDHVQYRLLAGLAIGTTWRDQKAEEKITVLSARREEADDHVFYPLETADGREIDATGLSLFIRSERWLPVGEEAEDATAFVREWGEQAGTEGG